VFFTREEAEKALAEGVEADGGAENVRQDQKGDSQKGNGR
jgi:hypothetical protein